MLVHLGGLFEAALQAVQCEVTQTHCARSARARYRAAACWREEKTPEMHPQFLLFHQRWPCLSRVSAPPYASLAPYYTHAYAPVQLLQERETTLCPFRSQRVRSWLLVHTGIAQEKLYQYNWRHIKNSMTIMLSFLYSSHCRETINNTP